MLRTRLPALARSVLALFALCGLTAPALAWPLGAPLYTSRYPIPPSQYGYNLDDTHPGYYGGGRYREYYSFGRGYGLANFPGPLPYSPYWDTPPNYRTYHGAPPAPAVVVLPEKVLGARIVVSVPEGAELWIQGMKSQQTGTTRSFVSPPLAPDETYAYEVRARWKEADRDVEQVQRVPVRGGERVSVSFPVKPEPEVVPAPRLVPAGE